MTFQLIYQDVSTALALVALFLGVKAREPQKRLEAFVIATFCLTASQVKF